MSSLGEGGWNPVGVGQRLSPESRCVKEPCYQGLGDCSPEGQKRNPESLSLLCDWPCLSLRPFQQAFAQGQEASCSDEEAGMWPRGHKPSFSFGINRVQSWDWGGAITGSFLEEDLLLCHALCDPSGPQFLLLHVGHRMAPGSQALVRGQQSAGMRCPVGRSHSRSWKALIASTTHLYSL